MQDSNRTHKSEKPETARTATATTTTTIKAATATESTDGPNSSNTMAVSNEPTTQSVRMAWGKPVGYTAPTSLTPSGDTHQGGGGGGGGNPPKSSLLDIMREEAKTSEVNRRLMEDEALIKSVMEASLREANPAAQAEGGAPPDLPPSEEDEMHRAIQASLAETAVEVKANAAAAEASEAIDSATDAIATAEAATADTGDTEAVTAEEMEQIQKALREAEEKELAASLHLAMHLQNHEHAKATNADSIGSTRVKQGHVRTITRAQYLKELQGTGRSQQPQSLDGRVGYDDDDDDDEYDTYYDEAGYRINSSRPSQWARLDKGIIIGPNNELRTKHDPHLQAQANAHRLQLDFEDEYAHVGNKAFNSFRSTMQKRTVKGVAAHGHGRANADAQKTREGALDGTVRLQIAKAINDGMIEKFNGGVKEGKEAMVYHAVQGTESDGYDVAIKVFKRIQEFRNRGDYVTGDSRFTRKDFSKAGPREQLSMWTEKEFRNLIRASKAGVPVPKPLSHSDNVLFMRFLGEDGWPSPQIRELEIKKGSKKWVSLYEQTMEAMQKLYTKARLVHGDLSEYNIMVCPMTLLMDNPSDVPPDDKDALQIVLIDFGQAVDHRHPDAEDLLKRDVLRVKEFFERMGISCISEEAAYHYVTTEDAPLRPAV